jgi:hypothetical protein
MANRNDYTNYRRPSNAGQSFLAATAAWRAVGFCARGLCHANTATVDDIQQIIDVRSVDRHDQHRAPVSDFFGDPLGDEVVAERGRDVVTQAGVKVAEFDAIEYAAKRSHHVDAHTQSICNRPQPVNLDHVRGAADQLLSVVF